MTLKAEHPILADIQDGDHVYYVHSYHFNHCDENYVLATSDYGQDITAIVARDNIVGIQFHPEKSQRVGLKILSNFMNWATSYSPT